MTKTIIDTNSGDVKVIDKLKEDALDFFLGKRNGNLWPYLYGTPENENDSVRGGILYNEMLEGEKDYYLYKYESALYNSKGHLLTSLIGSNATFIELGPGSEQSIRLKTLPLLRTCSDLHGYVGIDISKVFVDKVIEVIRSEFPDIFLKGIQQDFTQLKNLPQFPKTVIFFKGSTIGNLTQEEVPTFISQIKGLVKNDHYLFLANDVNQDEDSLMKAYDNKGMRLFMENIMYRLKRDLNLEMSAEAFSYKPEWHQASHDLKHVLTATESQSFELAGKTIEIKKGQKFHTLSSFKYPVEVFQKMISAVGGYKPIDFFVDDANCLAAYLFQG